MDYKSLETKLIQKQNLYIRQLEEQLEVYRVKDEARELLIQEMNHSLNLLAEEISRLKGDKEPDSQEEEQF